MLRDDEDEDTRYRQHEVRVYCAMQCIEYMGMLLVDALMDKPPKW